MADAHADLQHDNGNTPIANHLEQPSGGHGPCDLGRQE